MPSGNSSTDSSDQFPSLPTTATPRSFSTTPPLSSRSTSPKTDTVAPISPVPVIVGVWSFVTGNRSNTGGFGEVVSTSMLPTADGSLVFPAGSVSVAESAITPSDIDSPDTILHVPSDSTVVVPISVSVLPLPSRSTSAVTVTVIPTVP